MACDGVTFILLILVSFLFYADIRRIVRPVSSCSIIISYDALRKLSTPLDYGFHC